MWFDNCLLLFPLRFGATAWAVVIALYSFAGSLFLLRWGQYIYFVFPEWYIYGGIGMGVMALAIINVFALYNCSYVWVRVCKFLWPFVLVICTVRAIFMIWELQHSQTGIAWECANGGQLYDATPLELEEQTVSMPMGICSFTFAKIWTAFIISLLIDIDFQMYMLFLNWRYSKQLEQYIEMKGPMEGGYYNAYNY